MLNVMMIDEQARSRFLEDGYLVVPDVVPRDLCQNVVDAIAVFTGIDPHDPQTWYDPRFTGLGIVPLHHHEALWAVRQHPDVYEVFRRLHGRDELWVSMDRVGYKPPASPETTEWTRSPFHWDCDPWTFDGFSLQGIVYLTDTTEDQGAFCCVPSIYRHLNDYRREHANDETRRQPVFLEKDVVSVPGTAGSLVIFHRLMPHTNGINRAAKPRYAQYVTMDVAGGEDERLARVHDWQTRMPPAWAVKQKISWQQVPEPGDPAPLTELGKKLVGVTPW
ncbi:MAG: phytanoyl-CoA dioxygenase family protein [Pseudomonadales bacterium]